MGLATIGHILKIRDWTKVGKDLMVSSRLLQQRSKHCLVSNREGLGTSL